jgi:hypothetical protein
MTGAQAVIEAITARESGETSVISLQELHSLAAPAR